MKTILFFGDSNIWGYDTISTRRFPFDVRFTGRVSRAFPEHHIIAEGLKGRTNSIDDSLEPDRSGVRSLPMIMNTHDPVDIFVIMLGTNDVKRKFDNSAYEIARGLERNIQIVQAPFLWDGVEVPKILIVAPPGVTADYEGSAMEGSFDKKSVETSKRLPKEFQKIAEKYQCEFLNAMEYCGPRKEDGVHLDEEGHRKLADAVIEKLKTML